MARQRVTTRVITLLVVTLVLLGLWQTGSGAWIYVKARLAQVLLQRAWVSTLAGQQDVKPWPWADTWPIARLVVPSQGIDQIVLEGAYRRTLAFGPGRLESGSSAKRCWDDDSHRPPRYAFSVSGKTSRRGNSPATDSNGPVASFYGARWSDRRFTHRFDVFR